ncbi:MAG: hypothetical protein WD024_08130 [Bacillota bacterium]
MPRHKYRFRMYQTLAAEAPAVLDEARKAAQEIGLDVPASPAKRSGEDLPGEKALDHIREVVKGSYGGDYDCCVAGTPSSALWMTCQAAFAGGHSGPAPQILLPRCLAPRQKGLMAPGAVIPPKYEHLRGPGDYPIPKTRAGFDVVVVPLQGAVYGNHGVSNSPVSLLASVNPEASLEVLAASAEVHAPYLCGIYSQGSSTPGCGFGRVDDQGVDVLHKGIGDLAAEFDVPHVTDQTYALPFLSGSEAEPGTSVTVYGHRAMDGLGLIIGTEDLVTPILKGITANRGEPTKQPGLRALQDLVTDLAGDPDRYTRSVSRLYDTVTEELGHLAPEFKKALRVGKNSASLSVEINYEDTWGDEMGFPIFTVEDSRNGANLLEAGIAAMGISTMSVLEASIVMHLPDPGQGRFQFDEERAGLELKGLVRLLEIIGKRAGYLD